MRCIAVAKWLMLSCVLAAGCSGDANVKEVAALEGDWNWVAIEERGVISSPKEIQGQKWSIKGDVITATVPGLPVHKMAYKLNSSKTPKEMDLMPQYDPHKGTVTPTIYELDAGKLRVCCPDPNAADKVRPADFTEGAMIFERIVR
jgi:uncharacterized protein (TIGR03067 family)